MNLSDVLRHQLKRTALRCWGAALGTMCVSFSACDWDATGIQGSTRPVDIRRHISEALAARLDSRGRFVLPAPAAGAYSQVTPGEAAELALFAGQDAGRSTLFRSRLEEVHGAKIDFSKLRANSRVYYAATPYEPIPATFHPGLRNFYGPYYLVELEERGRPVVSVAVAAYGEARVRDGQLIFPDRVPLLHGNEFQVQGIPRGKRYSIPVSPEQAVALVGSATHTRIVQIPELIRPEVYYASQFVRWKVTLSHPVLVRVPGSAQSRCVRQLFVGLWGNVSVPHLQQPTSEPVRDLDGDPQIPLGIRPAVPIKFEEVSPTSTPCTVTAQAGEP